MNYKISFQEMDKLGMEQLSHQPLLTLEEKRKQFMYLRQHSAFRKATKTILW